MSCTPFLTLVSDISDLDFFKQRISKNYLYNIRCAQKECIEVNYNDSKMILNDSSIVEEFRTV